MTDHLLRSGGCCTLSEFRVGFAVDLAELQDAERGAPDNVRGYPPRPVTGEHP